MTHDLEEAESDTVQENIDKVVVCDLGIDIESTNIIHTFWCSTCQSEVPDLVKSSA